MTTTATAPTATTYAEIEAAVLPMFRDARDHGYLLGGEAYVKECASSLVEWAVNNHWDGTESVTIPGTYSDLFCDYQDYLVDRYIG